MITKQQINTMFQNDVGTTREWRKQYKADYAQIEIVFNETREIGPRKTVETLIDRVGYDRAEAVVATMINSIGEWDGRISDRNRAWAKTIDEAFDREAAQDAYIFCSIHSCHADQIASEMRRAERPIETVGAVEEESVEETAEEAAETVTEATQTVAETEESTEDESEEDTEKRIEMLAWSIQDAIERENTGAMTDEEIEQIEAEQTEETEGETLYLERRGCEFETDRADGIGNFRVCTVGESIPVKDSASSWGEGEQHYFFEFSKADKWTIRTENRRTGAKLKKPVRELVNADVLHVSTQFTPSHLSYRDGQMEADQWKNPSDYTERAILDFVNSVSTKHYGRIEYVFTFDIQVDENRNFTPRSLMHEWAKANRVQEVADVWSYRVALYSGLYEYGHWKISDRDIWGNAAKPGKVNVTVFLKKCAV